MYYLSEQRTLSGQKNGVAYVRSRYDRYEVAFSFSSSAEGFFFLSHKAQGAVYTLLRSNHFHSMFAPNTGTFVPIRDCALSDRVSVESET